MGTLIKYTFSVLLTILPAVLFLSSTANAENLVIPGSGNPEYALARLAEAFNAQQSRHHVAVPTSSGTSGALREVLAGTATLARVGRPLRKNELAKGLTYVPLGRDPVVFVAGAQVTVRAVTSEQILAVYRGTLTNWELLGGTSAHIRAIGREVTDASRRAISNHLKPFKDIVFGKTIKMVHLDPQLVELLDRYPTSLGFLNRSALSACSTRVVPLALDGVEPSTRNVTNGSYPLWLEFGLIYKPDALTPAGEAFLLFVQSDVGSNVLRNLGVLPTPPAP